METGNPFMRDWEVVAKGTRLTEEFASFFKAHLDNTPVGCSTLAKPYGLDGQRLEEWCRSRLSGFYEWQERAHADRWLLFEKNMGPFLSIDETSLSDDELYTILSNKEAKGRKGAIVAIIKGTRAEEVQEVLLRMRRGIRHKVKEVTLDMATNKRKA